MEKYDGRAVAIKGETLIGVYDGEIEAIHDLESKRGPEICSLSNG